MSKSIRIRTTPGESKNIQIKVEQDFDFLEIMSLKISQQDLYTSFCANYGVVVGRVIVNKGVGIPNAKVSVFVPITSEDEKNELIRDLYPFKEVTSKNKDNVRYNLLLSKTTCELNVPAGTFPTKEEVLNNNIMIEIFDKYYKYTTKTNDSGDYMIFGVPTGQQTIHMDADLSDTGPFSIRPYDFIDSGYSKELFESRVKFKTSENLNDLPQIKSGDKGVNVIPFWGDEEQCLIGITRVDFDTNFKIQPTSVLVGSVFTDNAKNSLNKRCNPKNDQGQHVELRTGPGSLKAIRVNDYTYEGLDQGIIPDKNTKIIPLSLEEFVLPQGPTSVDENGAFVVTVPMNIDHVITDEEGNLVPSLDPEKGIPTKGMYRFKLKFLEPAQGKYRTAQLIFPSLNRDTGGDPIDTTFIDFPTDDFPVGQTPQVNDDPDALGLRLGFNNTTENVRWSDNISVWNAPGPNESLDTIYKDFHLFNFNQIYSISQYMTKYKKGGNRMSYLGMKDIDEATFNPFPMSTIIKGSDILYSIMKPIIKLQVGFMKMLTTLSSFWFFFKIQIGIKILGKTYNIIGPCKGIAVRPFGFLQNISTPTILECDSDDNFPLTIDNWQCGGDEPDVCNDDLVQIRVGFSSPACELTCTGGPHEDGHPCRVAGYGKYSFHCNDPLCLVGAWLCCALFDLAKDRNVLMYTFHDAWITGTAYLPQFKFKSKIKGDGTTKDKFCGPGGDTTGSDNYKNQRCCKKGGGAFGNGPCDKCIVRGPSPIDGEANATPYHKNSYSTGASDINDMVMCPESYPTKIVNLGKTDVCPDVIDRINRCISSQNCLLSLYSSTAPGGCPATISAPQTIATSACFTGTYYEKGYDTTQWAEELQLTSYQDPAAALLSLMGDCTKGVDSLFKNDYSCGTFTTICEECQLNDDAWNVVREISKIYTDIILEPDDPTDQDSLISYAGLEADIGLAKRFNPTAPAGVNSSGGADTDTKLGDFDRKNHIANTPYFYFGLYPGRTAIDRLRKDYLVDKS